METRLETLGAVGVTLFLWLVVSSSAYDKGNNELQLCNDLTELEIRTKNLRASSLLLLASSLSCFWRWLIFCRRVINTPLSRTHARSLRAF